MPEQAEVSLVVKRMSAGQIAKLAQMFPADAAADVSRMDIRIWLQHYGDDIRLGVHGPDVHDRVFLDGYGNQVTSAPEPEPEPE